MKYEDLQRVKNLGACIEACQHNIAGYQEFKKAKEIKITVNDVVTIPKTMYFTGKVKDAIVDLLTDKETKILNERLSELEEL